MKSPSRNITEPLEIISDGELFGEEWWGIRYNGRQTYLGYDYAGPCWFTRADLELLRDKITNALEEEPA